MTCLKSDNKGIIQNNICEMKIKTADSYDFILKFSFMGNKFGYYELKTKDFELLGWVK